VSVAAAAASLLGSPAWAQTPVEGGGDFAQAPVIQPGAYTDSIRLGERLYYAVELAAGQRLRVRATVVNPTDSPLAALASLDLELLNPQRIQAESDRTIITGADNQESLTVTGGPVGSADPSFADPGIYFASLSMLEVSEGFEDVEYPVELVVEASGGDAPVVGPTATPATPHAAEPPPPRAGGVATAESRGWRFSELAMFGVIGLFAGAFLGALGAARWRR